MLDNPIQVKLRTQIDYQLKAKSILSNQMDILMVDYNKRLINKMTFDVRKNHLQVAVFNINKTIYFLEDFYKKLEVLGYENNQKETS